MMQINIYTYKHLHISKCRFPTNLNLTLRRLRNQAVWGLKTASNNSFWSVDSAIQRDFTVAVQKPRPVLTHWDIRISVPISYLKLRSHVSLSLSLYIYIRIVLGTHLRFKFPALCKMCDMSVWEYEYVSARYQIWDMRYEKRRSTLIRWAVDVDALSFKQNIGIKHLM